LEQHIKEIENMSTNAKNFSEDVGFDDEVRSFEFEKYSGVKGQTDRLAFVHLNAKGKPIVKKAQIHYVEGIGYIKSNEYTLKKFGAPRARYVTIIGHYKTNKLGKIENPKNMAVNCKFFILSDKKYALLKAANDEFPLEKHDLMATCVEEKFQQLQFQSCKEAAWVLIPEVKASVLEQVSKLEPHLDRQLCQDLTVEQIKEKLNDVEETPVEAASGESTEASAESIIANL
jgi:hypothetical protein